MNKRGYYAAHGFEKLRETACPHGAEQKIIFAKAKTTLFAFAPCTARAVQGKRVNFRPFYNRKALFDRVPENRNERKHCEIFGKEAKQCRSACGLE